MPYRIYYLDDELDLVNLFKAFITGDNIEVKTFTDAKEAIACCNIAPPDLMFIDYRLADTTGDRVASELDKGIKKILLTGELDMDVNTQFEQVIRKPFKLTCIKKLIEEMVAQRHILA